MAAPKYGQPIMGVSDVANYYGVSRQLAAKWARTWKDWPAPFAEVAAGTFWTTEDVLTVCAAHERKPGAGPRPAGDPMPPSARKAANRVAKKS